MKLLLDFLSRIFSFLFALFFMSLNFVSCSILFFGFSPLKIFFWIKPINNLLRWYFTKIGLLWVWGNSMTLFLTQKTKWTVRAKKEDLDSLSLQNWYFLVANHQSAVDILVLQKIFLGRIPFLKFFIKKELIWVPVLGLCWWILDFPFLERGRKRDTQKDFKTLQRVTKQCREVPTTLISFLEGTRLNNSKSGQLESSPYKNLLPPKGGGFALVMETLGKKINGKLLDVTIFYPDKSRGLVDLFTGKMKEIVVDIRVLQIPQNVIDVYQDSQSSKENVYAYINNLWEEKDRLLTQLKEEHSC